MWKFTAFSEEAYTPFLKYVCVFFISFSSSGVLTGSYVKEKCTYNQLADGCVQMGVYLLVDVNHWLGLV